MNATKVVCDVCRINPAVITFKFGNPVLSGNIPVCADCAGYDPTSGRPMKTDEVWARIANGIRARARAGKLDLKYLYAPCVDCFQSLPNTEQVQYAPNWDLNGRCPMCRHLYCGTCRRVLFENGLDTYVDVVNQDNGDQFMVCDHCRTEHLYFGGRDIHLMGYRLPGHTEWKGV